MSQWKLELSEEVLTAIRKAVSHHTHLKGLINQRLQALLEFPPHRWFRNQRGAGQATFFPEPGQKIRLTGLVDFKTRKLQVTRFSFHE